jgi:predicted GH43/DUF377 family glycosyl hydrolase
MSESASIMTTTGEMKRSQVTVRRLPIRLTGDDRRVIARPFLMSAARCQAVLLRIEQLSEEEVEDLLDEVRRDYASRHRHADAIFDENYRTAASLIGWKNDWDLDRRLLAGSYFTMEYAIDSAALFNPSIVAHPDQADVPAGGLRFVMSLRATGEGHVSSVVFRTGILTRDCDVLIDPPPIRLHRSRIKPDRRYVKSLFLQKLIEMGVVNDAVERVFAQLEDIFTIVHLRLAIEQARALVMEIAGASEALRTVLWLATSNYQVELAPEAMLNELVIFPMSDDDSHGIEDVRLVRFVDDDGVLTYYGTYTAYNGVRTLPMMMATGNFRNIEIHSLNGAGAANKGMALFPRKIGGQYVMCSRIDGENLYISTSDSAYFWESATRLVGPKYSWEFMQIGNCGSPIETDEGWLLLTHGVGPMRTYAIGAVLLDKNDPLTILAQLPEPLIEPSESEREGYVPNVVYTCGALIHENMLYVPYAQADKSTTLAIVRVDELLNALLDHRN